MITRICDVCGQPIDDSLDTYYNFKKHMWFGTTEPFYGKEEVDICGRCGDIINKFIEDKNLMKKVLGKEGYV